jgi:hypothetical protein
LDKPIHIHAVSKDGRVCRVFFHIENKEIVKIEYKNKDENNPLTLPQMRNLKALVEQEKYAIINAWISYYVLHSPVKTRKITTKIK